jgi:hypothetical protein
MMQAPQAPEEQEPLVAAQTRSEPAQGVEKQGWQLSPEGDAAILHGDIQLPVASVFAPSIQCRLYESVQAAMPYFVWGVCTVCFCCILLRELVTSELELVSVLCRG